MSFVVRGVGSVVAMALVARELGPDLQGRFGYAHWLGAIGAQMALWGLGIASTRFVARALGAGDPQAADEAVRLAQAWLIRILACVFPLGLLASWSLGGELRDPLLVAMVMLVSVTLFQWRLGVAMGIRRYDIAFVGYLLFYALLFAGLSVSLTSTRPVVDTMAVFALGRGLHAVLVWRWTAQALRALCEQAPQRTPTPGYTTSHLRRGMGRYTTQMAIIAFFGALLWERTALPFLKASGDYIDVGLYIAAFSLTAMVQRVPGALAQVMVPAVAELEGAGGKQEVIARLWRRSALLLTALIIPMVLVLFALAPWVVDLLYGSEFERSTGVLRVLLLPLLVSGAAAASAKTLVGVGQQHRLLVIAANAAAAKMLLFMVLIPRWGILGAAWAVAISFTGAFVAETVAARRCLREET